MKIEYDPLAAYPDAELVRLTVPLPQEIIQQIDEALEAFPSLKSKERFIAFAVLFALADLHHDAAATLDRT